MLAKSLLILWKMFLMLTKGRQKTILKFFNPFKHSLSLDCYAKNKIIIYYINYVINNT